MVISKLKMQCGSSSTNKLEKMTRDFMLIEDNTKHFKNYLVENNIIMPYDFNVSILTYGSWPTFKAENLILPNEMVKSINIYNTYYMSKNTSQKLQWVYQTGDITLNSILNNNKYIINCNVYQAIILQLFNNTDMINYNEIHILTNIDKKRLSRILHSLTCSKYKLLSKSSSNNSISENENFSINTKFKNKSRKFKLLCPNLDISKKKEKIEIDRSVTIDASIVRIMKSRKILTHSDLLTEVISQLHMFTPTIKSIKKRIENMIDRDYIERTEDNNNTYRYLP